MVTIHIPFKPRFEEPMLKGVKTWTARTRRYGKPGDTFTAFGDEFRILKVERRTLEDVADHWAEEGFINKLSFIEFWKRIHPRKGYVPSQRVYVHIFKDISI